MAAVADGVRFVLEVVGIGSAACWGYHASSAPLIRWVQAIGTAVVLVVVWAFVVAPGAENSLSPTLRMLIGSGLLLLAGLGLWVSNQRTPAIVFAVAIVLDTAAMLAFSG